MQNILLENFVLNSSLDLFEILIRKMFCIHDISLFWGGNLTNVDFNTV